MKKSWKRLLSVVLSVVMVLTIAAPALAAAPGSYAVTPYPARSGAAGKALETHSKVSAEMGKPPGKSGQAQPEYADDEIVRASIVLTAPSTLESGYPAAGIGKNLGAINYRSRLSAVQRDMAGTISAQVLDGEKLDVVWNLTLAANIISANVPYGKLEKIKSLSGVKTVVVEQCYEPAREAKTQGETSEKQPNMGTSGTMIGSSAVWADGYYGAGTRIAIVDTGLDVEHQSFDAGAFEYAIGDNKDILMDADDVASVWGQLNASSFIDSADGVYINSKIPYGINYVDRSLDVTHMADTAEEHGSHVAGIAAANRFVPSEEAESGYAPALDEVLVQGVAPDAQVLVMKVFGRNGGAYESDYMSAIEDAIILGADAVNLSLGSSSAGTAQSASLYEDLLNELTQSDMVLSVSAGNNSYWAEQTYYGDLLDDDVNYLTAGEPGTWADGLTVASADNTGSTGYLLYFADGSVTVYSETEYGNEPMVTLAGEQEYVLIDCVGVDGEGYDYFAAMGSEMLSGKIVMCYRGESTFSEKANAAAAQGAAGIIIVNNQDGMIQMLLTDYKYTVPCVSVTQEAGEKFWETADDIGQMEDGTMYCIGTITVGDKITSNTDPDALPKMSSFSSWGVPGDLSMKPEITAPGGSIYSLNGLHNTDSGLVGGHDAYELMSGTSMAAPQVAGMAALVSQYIRENGLAEKTGLSVRQLSTSLLMGTAVPMYDETYYMVPVLQQGAGLANVAAAINAHSYILMGSDATESYADGKVKVELGDDPERTGSYAFSFTLNNMTGEAREYNIGLDLFTQWRYWGYSLNDTDWLDADVTITAGGKSGSFSAYSNDTVPVTVPASGSVEVKVSIENIDDFYDEGTGMWIEGFVYAYEYDEEEGAIGDDLSIPILGYYGSWTEPRMTDVGSIQDYAFSLYTDAGILYYPDYYLDALPEDFVYEDRDPYMAEIDDSAYANQVFSVLREGYSDEEYLIGFNPVDLDAPYEIDPDRAAIRSADTISNFYYSLIRNAADRRFTVTDEAGNVLYEETYGSEYAAYYDEVNSVWVKTSASKKLGYKPTGVEDGERLTFGFTFAPEYYLDENGEVKWDEVHPNATITAGAYVDNTKPEIVGTAVLNEDGSLTVQVKDNLYVAGVSVYDPEDYNDGGYPLAYQLAQEQEKGDTLTYTFTAEEVDTNAHPQLVIEVMDYAYNTAIYTVNFDPNAEITEIRISNTEITTMVGSSFSLSAMILAAGIDDRVVWESSDPSIAIVDTEGEIVSAPEEVLVTPIGAGTVTITVTSVADPSLSATCTVTVKSIDTRLKSFVWDEEGVVWYSELDINKIPEYTQIAQVDETIVSAAVSPDGVIYAASYGSVWNLYTFDPDTYELTLLSEDIPFAMTDMAYSPTLDLIVGTAVYEDGEYAFLTLFTPDGECLGGLETDDYAAAESGYMFAPIYLEGIAYVESYTEQIPAENLTDTEGGGDYIETQVDVYLGVDRSGDLYGVYLYAIGEELYVDWGMYPIINMGAPVDYDWGQSLYSDGEYLYWSRFCYSEDDVDMLVCDLDTFDVYNVGSYDESVWPVNALFEYSPEPEPEPAPEPGPTPFIPLIPGTGYSMPIPFLPLDELPPLIPPTPADPTDPKQPMPYLPAPTDPNPKPGSSSAPTTPVSDPKPTTGSGLPFTDVDPASELYDYIKAVYDKGLMAGMSDTYFDLYGSLTRAMIVSILYRMEGSPEITYSGKFSDIAEGEWYASGVEWAATVGIAAGYEDGSFGPNDPVTREQLAAFLYRYANWKGYAITSGELVIDDADLISPYALDALKWAVKNDMLWIDDDALRPTELARRWEIAVAIFYLLENVAK